MIPIKGTKLFIDDNRRIFDENGTECCNTRSDNLVVLELYGETQTVDREWLYILAKFNLWDKRLARIIQFTPLDSDVKYCRDKFPYYVTFTRPVYCEYKGINLRIVPRFPNLAVSRDGTVLINRATRKLIKTHVNPYGYFACSIHDCTCEEYRVALVHRLVANAWIRNPDPVRKVTVNHINGIKTDNRAENLEWASYQENDAHKARTGLMDTTSCRIRNAITGEELSFISTAEAFRHIGIKNQEWSHFVEKRPTSLVNHEWEVRIGDDDTPWFYDSNCLNRCASRYVFTVTDQNGEVVKVNGVIAFIRKYKLWNITNNAKVLVREFEQRYPGYQVSLKDYCPTATFEVLDQHTNQVTTYPSVRELARAIKQPRSCIIKSIKSGGRHLIDGRYQVRRHTKRPWPAGIDPVNAWRTILVHNQVTNEDTVYESLRAVAAALNMSRTQVNRLLRHPRRGDLYTLTLGSRTCSQ